MIDPKLPACAICKRPVRGVWATDDGAKVSFSIHCHGAFETVEVDVVDGRAAIPEVAFAPVTGITTERPS